MGRLDDLIDEVKDPGLRKELLSALSDMKRKQRFGLVFEEHIPETTALMGLPIQAGLVVQRRDREGNGLCRVKSLLDGRKQAQVVPLEGGKPESISTRELLVVKRFGDPIYPALTSIGTLSRGGDKASHAVINGENYHALQLLNYTVAGSVDCIYVDPPYNTGARDWKYNNRYVDAKDTWRHSKWLSFMEKRLRLARRLLKANGVIVVTIDEHEVNHLGLLLEKLFPDAYRQLITIVMNPKGVTQGRFSRVDEYAFFCFFGGASTIGGGDDLLTPGIDDEDTVNENGDVKRPRWKGLLRSGTNARRQDRKAMFYPVLIDTERRAVVGAGDPLPFEEQPDFMSKVDGFTAVWPVRKDKSLGNWGVGAITLRQLIKQGYVALGEFDEKRNTWALSYLGKEAREQIQSGVLEIVSRDEVRNVVDVQYTEQASRRMKTVWHRSRHDAGVGGTDVLRHLVGGRPFSFAKSVYAVHDCLAAVLRDRPDALILDFFAGSGTTLHATAMLNASDDGRRRCILVTNNEVEAEVAARLHKSGIYRGEREYEEHGVFEMATRPRIEAVITGHRADGSVVPGEHIDGRPFAQGFPENVEFFRVDYLDPDEVDLGKQFEAILPSLWLAAGGKGPRTAPEKKIDFLLPEESFFAILLNESKFEKFRKNVALRNDITHVWLVTDSEEAYAEMKGQLPRRVYTSMLYRDYLRNFQITS